MEEKVQNKVRHLRRRRDLSQEQLGQALGVTRHTILAIENGKYEPSIGLALKMARYFQMPLEEIFWLPTKEEGGSDVQKTNG